jgi:hypothetical protein
VLNKQNQLITFQTSKNNNGCTVNADYEPPEDGLVRVEIYRG